MIIIRYVIYYFQSIEQVPNNMRLTIQKAFYYIGLVSFISYFLTFKPFTNEGKKAGLSIKCSYNVCQKQYFRHSVGVNDSK